MGMLDLGRTDKGAVPLPEENRGFVFFDLAGNLCYKKDDGSVTIITAGRDGKDGAEGRRGADGVPGRDGQNGLKGDKGDRGDQGVPGKNGADAVPTSRMLSPFSSSISAVSVVSLGVLNLTAGEIAAGAIVDLSVFGVCAVGSTQNGRMSIRLLINGNLVATALQTAAIGANASVQAFRVDGKLIVKGVRADWFVVQQYGAALAQQVGQAPGLAGASIELQAAVTVAALGFVVSPRAVSMRA
jgi:hypothetical protein